MPQELHLLVLGTHKVGREGRETEDMAQDQGGICTYPAERPPAGLAEAESAESKVKGEKIQPLCGRASRCQRGCLSPSCSSHCCPASLPSSAKLHRV